MAKQMVEIDVPEGMLLNGKKTHHEGCVKVYFEPIPKTKWRAVTKLDLLSVDSIPGRVRDRSIYKWGEADIAAVLTGSLGGYSDCDGTLWRYAEIEVPVDEQPPREAWVRYYKDEADPWSASYGTESEARQSISAEVIRMIEVPTPKK